LKSYEIEIENPKTINVLDIINLAVLDWTIFVEVSIIIIFFLTW
jgi:hypothetical protein